MRVVCVWGSLIVTWRLTLLMVMLEKVVKCVQGREKGGRDCRVAAE